MSTLRHPEHLDELLNFRLLRLFALSGAPVVRLLEGRHGITRREWRLLATLASRGPLSPSALAAQAHLDRARTSRAIGALVAKGLVVRTVRADDARRAEVAPTPAGQALFDTVFPRIAAINAGLVAVLDDATLQALDRALDALTAHAERLNADIERDVKADRRGGGTARVRPRDAAD